MATTKMDLAAVEKLQNQIDAELKEVKKVLKKVKKVCENDPKDDTVIGAIDDYINTIDTAWDALGKTFDTVGTGMSNLLSDYKRTVQEKEAKAKGLKKTL